MVPSVSHRRLERTESQNWIQLGKGGGSRALSCSRAASAWSEGVYSRHHAEENAVAGSTGPRLQRICIPIRQLPRSNTASCNLDRKSKTTMHHRMVCEVLLRYAAFCDQTVDKLLQTSMDNHGFEDASAPVAQTSKDERKLQTARVTAFPPSPDAVQSPVSRHKWDTSHKDRSPGLADSAGTVPCNRLLVLLSSAPQKSATLHSQPNLVGLPC